VLDGVGDNTHMPFLVGRVLLFCRGAGKRWKAHAKLPDGRIVRLRTRLPRDACECSPIAWCDDTLVGIYR
jgi:hypothetical protein